MSRPNGTLCRCGATAVSIPPSPNSLRTAAPTIASTQHPLQPHCPSKIGLRRFRHGLFHELMHASLLQSLRDGACASDVGNPRPSSPALFFDGLYSSSPQANPLLLPNAPCINALASASPVVFVRKGIVCSPISVAELQLL